MSSTTVSEFANELKKSTETLLEQLKSAGVAKTAASDPLTESDKQHLLSYLQASHGTASPERKKITLVKKLTSEIKQADGTGKARTIQVEVRKKRTFIRRDDGSDATESAVLESATVETVQAPEVDAPAAPLIDHAELSRREEEARHQAEFIRRQEEELVERRRQREAQEAREHEVAEKAAAAAATVAAEVAKKEQLTPSSQEAAAEAAALNEAKAKAVVDARQKAIADSKARADEEAARAADLNERRRKAEAEAAAIRTMMSSPAKKAPVIKKEEPKVVKAADAAKAGMKGTLHKPAAGTGVAKPATTGAGTGTTGAGKEVKSAKLLPAGPVTLPRKKPSRRAVTPVVVWAVAAGAVGPVANEVMIGITTPNKRNQLRLKREFWTCTCPKPSRCLSSHTRWRSKPLRSSNT